MNAKKFAFADVICVIAGQSQFLGKVKVRRVSNRTIACHEAKIPEGSILQDKHGHSYSPSGYPLSPAGETYFAII